MCSLETGDEVLLFDSKAASDAAKALCILSISSSVFTGNDLGLRAGPLGLGGITGAAGGGCSSPPAALSPFRSSGAAKWFVCTMCSPNSLNVPNPVLHTLQVRTALTLSLFGTCGGGGGGGGRVVVGGDESVPFHEVICSFDITFV